MLKIFKKKYELQANSCLRMPLSLEKKTEDVIVELAENNTDVAVYLNKIRHRYSDYMVIFVLLEDLNIRGNQILFALHMVQFDIDKFYQLILLRPQVLIDSVNYLTTINYGFDKAVNGGATNLLKFHSEQINSLFLNKEECSICWEIYNNYKNTSNATFVSSSKFEQDL